MTQDKSDQQTVIVQALFDTQAIRVSPASQPFWYTSGTLGPYYINTHFVYGSEQEANQLLSQIEQAVRQPLELPAILSASILEHVQQQPVFKAVIHQLVLAFDDLDFDFVSGGERRDFFFSIPVAARLCKPHVAILKDGQAIWSDANFQNARLLGANDLKGQTAVHVADLVTEASSYTRAWLPALGHLGASIHHSVVVVDRNQGGLEILQAAGVELTALATIDTPLFSAAQTAGLIDANQAQQLETFIADPHQFMIRFLKDHPDFLAEQIALGGKSAERAKRCLEQGYGKS